jgi:hypothetical protein
LKKIEKKFRIDPLEGPEFPKFRSEKNGSAEFDGRPTMMSHDMWPPNSGSSVRKKKRNSVPIRIPNGHKVRSKAGRYGIPEIGKPKISVLGHSLMQCTGKRVSHVLDVNSENCRPAIRRSQANCHMAKSLRLFGHSFLADLQIMTFGPKGSFESTLGSRILNSSRFLADP